MILAIVASLSAILPAADSAPAYKLEVAPARRVEAVLTYKTEAPRFNAGQWVFFSAKAIDLPGQGEASTTVEPAAAATNELSPAKRQVLRGKVVVTAKNKDLKKELNVRVTHKALLMARTLLPLKEGEKAPAVAPLKDAERKAATAWTTTYDFKSAEVRKWMDAGELKPKAGEGQVDFARRVYFAVKKGFTYEYRSDMDRKAPAVCKAGKSDCGGLAVLFATVLRANGIPARTLFGRWAESDKPGDTLGDIVYHQEHVKAEFFADGVGWVPVDLFSAVKFDKEPNGVMFFGNDKGDFLVMHVDCDLVLEPLITVKSTTLALQGVNIWMSGGGTLEGQTTTESWQVKSEDAKK